VGGTEGHRSSTGKADQPLSGRGTSYWMLSAFAKYQNLLVDVLSRDDWGGTAIEYGLLAAFIAVVIAGAVRTLGTRLVTMFTNLANAF
jgi:pilus assembly protein Flp/PilA